MGEVGEGKMAAAWRWTPCQVPDCVQPWPHWKLHTDPVIRALVAHFTGAETKTQWRENEPRTTVNKWQKGLKLRAGLNAKCISEMPASVETLPEQGTGMWAGLLRASWSMQCCKGLPMAEGSEAWGPCEESGNGGPAWALSLAGYTALDKSFPSWGLMFLHWGFQRPRIPQSSKERSGQWVWLVSKHNLPLPHV